MAISLDPGLKLQIGDHSYIHDHQIRNPSGALTEMTIGKFCSIATELTIIGYDHHSEWISTYPFLDDGHRVNWAGTTGIPYPQAKEFGSNKSRGNIQIGNDVWIGYNVKLFKGVSIGNGAVIGACSLVNKSVLPYTIVAGIPARPIRKRFSDTEILFLERIRWWDWPEAMINQHLHLLCSSNIGALEQFLGEDFVLPSEPRTLETTPVATRLATNIGASLVAVGPDDEERKSETEKWLSQADAHYAKGDLLAAVQALEQAVASTPNAVPLLTCLGNILFQLQRYPEALQRFQRAAILEPGNGDIQVRLASAASRCHEPALFRQALGRALELAPQNPIARRLAANELIDHGDFAGAAEHLCALLAQDPGNTESLMQLGQCLQELNDALSAQWCYERVLEIDPAHPQAGGALSGQSLKRPRSATAPAALIPA